MIKSTFQGSEIISYNLKLVLEDSATTSSSTIDPRHLTTPRTPPKLEKLGLMIVEIL